MNSEETRAEILKILKASDTGIQPDSYSAIECAKGVSATSSRRSANLLAKNTLTRHLSNKQNDSYHRTSTSGIRMTSGKSKAVAGGQVMSCVRVTQNRAFRRN